jgi:hypothetical protein
VLCETVNVTNPIYSIFSVMATQTSEVCVAIAPSVCNILKEYYAIVQFLKSIEFLSTKTRWELHKMFLVGLM